ncbi:MAG: hypothetical protein JST27_09020 [Bacteroidetes bacterium]|nr:hypothetical protein [Bacteroidota bacterium]
MRKTLLRNLLAGACIAALAAPSAQAQQKWTRYRAPEFVERPGWSVGMNFGLSDLWADVGTKSLIDHYGNSKYWGSPHFMGGVFTRYAFHPGFVFRAAINYGSVYANDNWNQKKAESATSPDDVAFTRYMRNLDVQSNIWEGNIMFEINPLRIGNLEKRSAKKRMQPYILLGGGIFHYRAKGTYVPRGTDGKANGQGRMVNLDDLYLENQGPSDPVTDSLLREANLSLPTGPTKVWVPEVCGGIGVRWDIANQVSLGLEYVYRYTFTDYLDNVSTTYVDPKVFDIIHRNDPEKAQMAKDMYDKSWLIDPNASHKPGDLRGESSTKDAYSTFSISVFFRIKTKRVPWWYQPGPGVY